MAGRFSTTPQTSSDAMGRLVMATAGLLFLASAYQLVTAAPSSSASAPSSKTKTQQDPSVASSSSSSSTAIVTSSSKKAPRSSSVHEITYATTPDMCSQPPQYLRAQQGSDNRRMTVRAGALLKLVDIAAGVAARRHARGSCVTISVDAVLLLKPIYLGELIHLSASVNRAWGTSMEIGVRVTKEAAPDSLADNNEEGGMGHVHGQRQYVSHAYLTFVAIDPKAMASPSQKWKAPRAHPGVNTGQKRTVSAQQYHSDTTRLGRLWRYLTFSPFSSLDDDGSKNAKVPLGKVTLAPVRPQTKLEARRHLLAGRRRAKRIHDAKLGEARDGVSIEDKKRVRQEVLDMEEERTRKGSATGAGGDEPSGSAAASGSTTPIDSTEDSRLARELKALEEEFVVRAWATHEPGITVDDGVVHVSLPGDAPFQLPEADVRAAAERLKITLPTALHASTLHSGVAPQSEEIEALAELERRESLAFLPTISTRSHTKPGIPSSSSLDDSIHVSLTQTTSMHIVFPEHSNSHGIIFGGNTMEWMEEVAILAARHVGRGRGWSTVAMDGLEFGVGVGVGELMILTAIVIKTYTNSCEVYVIAQAEDIAGTRRMTNDVLFTLASGASTSSTTTSSSLTVPSQRHVPRRSSLGAKGSTAVAQRIDEERQSEQQPLEPLKHVKMDEGTALMRFAEVADRRRVQRLDMRDTLVRLYGH